MKAYIYEELAADIYEPDTASNNKRLIFINQEKVRNILYDCNTLELLIKLDSVDERGENTYLYSNVKDPISFLRKIAIEI